MQINFFLVRGDRRLGQIKIGVPSALRFPKSDRSQYSRSETVVYFQRRAILADRRLFIVREGHSETRLLRRAFVLCSGLGAKFLPFHHALSFDVGALSQFLLYQIRAIFSFHEHKLLDRRLLLTTVLARASKC